MEKILKKYVLLSVWSVETECSSTAVRWGAAEILGQVLPVRRVEQEKNPTLLSTIADFVCLIAPVIVFVFLTSS